MIPTLKIGRQAICFGTCALDSTDWQFLITRESVSGNKRVPGERGNARNNTRCTQARKTTQGLDGQHQDVYRTVHGRVNQNDRGHINGESTSMVWPTLDSRTAKEQNRTDLCVANDGVCYFRETQFICCSC